MIGIEYRLFKPRLAIVLHSDDDEAFATKHFILPRNNKYVMGSGSVISVDEFSHIMDTVRPTCDACTQFLPPELLAYNPTKEIMVWHVSEQTRNIFLKVAGKHHVVSVRWPGLVFAVKGTVLYVYAVRDKGRPVPDTQLYNAPFGNVYVDGNVCVGSGVTPNSFQGISQMEEWEEFFFTSEFTHPNSAHQLLNGVPRIAVNEWWLKREGKSRFPYSKLVPSKIGTLNSMLRLLEDDQ